MYARIKICGITSVEDAIFVAQSGADAIGLVFYAPSPRAISIDQARSIVQAVPPFVTTVALFVDAEATRINQVVEQVGVDHLQFHGKESPAFCDQFSRPWMKAIRMRSEVDLLAEADRYAAASALLVDGYQPGVPGGTGEVFDWQRIPPTLERPLVLAGGLNSENVAEAIRQTRPWAVDVSGGVERAKGGKSRDKVARFIEQVRETPF